MTDTKQITKYHPSNPVQTTAQLKALLETSRQQLADIAAKQFDPDRLLKMVVLAANKQPKLLECTGHSLLQASMTAAELGLDCSGTMGQAYLVPYKKQATFIPGYRGLVELARRSGDVNSIYARVVCSNDHFVQRWGDNETIEHRPPDCGERGQPIGAYAIAVFKDGTRQREYMTHTEIEKIRSQSKAGNFGPWKDHWNEMARKTVVRRLCKYLPCAIDSPLARGLEADDATYIDQTFESVQDAARANAGKGRMRMPVTNELHPEAEPEPPRETPNDEYDPTSDPGTMFDTGRPTVGDD